MRLPTLLLSIAIAFCVIAVPATSSAQVFVSFSLLAPPPLPVYQQPQLVNPNYIWTPGYWAYGSSGYYWVAGSWEQPPQAGLLWTPGYWGYSQNGYALQHRGFKRQYDLRSQRLRGSNGRGSQFERRQLQRRIRRRENVAQCKPASARATTSRFGHVRAAAARHRSRERSE